MNQEVDTVALKERLAKNPGVILEGLCERYNVNMAEVFESLPETMWKRIDGTHFVEVLSQVQTLGSVTVIIHTEDAIFEVSGDFPAGETGHGFYNLMGGESGLHGHLRPERCKSIYFIERPFMKKDTASIQFMNQEGHTIFKIFLGRDETGQLRADQLNVFRVLAQTK